MKYWIGRLQMGVSILHTLFAVVVFRNALASMHKRSSVLGR